MNSKKMSPLFCMLVVIFTVCMLLSNIIANKQLAIGSWNTPAGVLVFPITYILSDVFSEIYGYKWSRRTAWIGFGMNLFMVFIFWLTITIPGPVWFENQEAFEIVLGNTPRLLIAGLAAYMFGDFANDRVFRKMKGTDAEGRGFKARAILSSLCGELVDSCIFMPCAFLGVLPAEQLPQMVVIQVVIKVGYEIVILPLTSIIVEKVRAYEKGLCCCTSL